MTKRIDTARKWIRHKAVVEGHGEYQSFRAALEALGLPLENHRAVRYDFKDAGDKGEWYEYLGYRFKAVRTN